MIQDQPEQYAVIYEKDGIYTLADRAGWLPGLYASPEAVLFACQMDTDMLRAVVESSVGRAISVEMLKARLG